MKKILAMLLCLVMAISLFAGCKTSGGEETKPSVTTPPVTEPTQDTTPVMADPEALPESALYHWDFETLDNLTAVAQGEKAADSINTGATYDIVPCDHEIMTADGVVGKSLYLDGTYGVKLEGLESLSDDSYTISFWVNATRLATFGPVVQIGRNIGSDGSDRAVTWLNFTKCSADWGAEMFPICWNRNSEKEVWPWISAGDNLEHGKREWCHVTVVVDGNEYVCTDDSLPRIGTKYYLNGVLMFDASADKLWYQGVSPEILKGDGIEGYIGINYWDTVFKGFVDELYIYDEALTAGQVASLYLQGDPTMTPVAPEGGDETPEIEPTPVTDITPNPDAIDTVGTPALDLGWWSDATASTELTEGGTITYKLHNYSDCAANWNNFLIGLCNTPITTDKMPSAAEYEGYAEWAVIRADAFGWAPEGATYTPTYKMSWTDWNEWLCLMADADVEIVLTRNDGVVTINITFTGADGTVMTSETVVVSNLTAADPCHVFLTGDHCYLEILSVE